MHAFQGLGCGQLWGAVILLATKSIYLQRKEGNLLTSVSYQEVPKYQEDLLPPLP